MWFEVVVRDESQGVFAVTRATRRFPFQTEALPKVQVQHDVAYLYERCVTERLLQAVEFVNCVLRELGAYIRFRGGLTPLHVSVSDFIPLSTEARPVSRHDSRPASSP